ncbi:glycosyl transferase [Paenibacillus swuensis]|uniref:Glycosyl transferase n=1 Tax=Paenibacillus swuensis TaxID=1178515 RepID=A0A172TLZ6_9BACL|nr:glycosyl transferase [Paenibacillus swuensis]
MLPKINQILHIQVASVDEDEARQEYKTRVSDLQEHHISIEVPIHEGTGRLKKLYVGDELSIVFITDGGIKHYFNSYVLGFREDTIRQVIIKKPELESITQIQRRTFLRITAQLEIAVRLSEQVRFVALTDDVGGGGISFICDPQWPLKFGDRLQCWLLVPYKSNTAEHANFISEVVRIKTLETGRQLVMLKFIEIAEMDRQRIIRYCFERQIDFRKK